MSLEEFEQLIKVLELEHLADLMELLYKQLTGPEWLQWTLYWAGQGYRHATDLHGWIVSLWPC